MKALTAILILLISLYACSKPIGYNVSNLIGSAQFVGEVVITNYDTLDRMIQFESLEFKDTLNKASCQICKSFDFPNPKTDQWTNDMPFVGDTVLIVVNCYGTASVFGKQIGDYYRLWSALYSGSIAVFRFDDPILPLDNNQILGLSGPTTSWDGCLFPTDQLRELVKKYRKAFREKLEKVELENFIDKEVYNLFYDESLKHYSIILWSDEPPGKLRSMILVYSNEMALEITPHTEGNEPVQLNFSGKFDLEKFKMMKIRSIEWVD